jgi:signal peptidase I
MSRGVESTYEIVRTVFVVVVFAILIRSFIVQPFIVEGRSMEPTFHDHDYLIVSKFDYRFHPPARGDVVVFISPTIPDTNFIKRIIGLPGELVRIDDSGVFVNGAKLAEPYLTNEPGGAIGTIERFLNDGEYWVMGDNRNHSSDSREWGPLGERAIIGRAWVTVFPRRDFGPIAQPSYSN